MDFASRLDVARGLRLLTIALAFVAGCPPSAMPDADAGQNANEADGERPDAQQTPDAPSTPLTIALDDGAGVHLEVSTNPLRLRLARESGEVLLETVPSGLELGIAPGGSDRYNDVTVPNPRNVRWHALDLGVERASPSEAIVADGAGRSARIALSRVSPGALRLRVTTESGAREVGLVRVRLLADDGSYQGLGERFTGPDARGHVVPMQMSVTSLVRESGLNEHHVPVPFLVSSRSYGVFVESREAGAFDVASTDLDEVRATFEGSALDVVFFVAPTPREVIAAYTRYTGLPILPPRWAFAPMHWRNVWDDRAQLEEDARALVDLSIPATSFWIDNPWMTSYTDNRFDERRFPRSAEMLRALRESGFRPLVWNVPYLDAPDDGVADNPAERLYEEAAREGYLVRHASGAIFHAPSAFGVSGLGQAAGMVDFTSPAAVAFWRRGLDPLVRDLGIRAFKLDYGEDVVPELAGARTRLRFADGTTERETHNVYARHYHAPYRQALDAHSDEGGFLLVRASCWGGQTVADIVWPGDIDSDMSRGDTRNVGGLPAAISAMVSLAASGFPSFASDTGGFREGPPTLETLLRWAEHTAFSPFLQLGGGGAHHNPWLYEPTPSIPDPTGTYRELARAHVELIPYFRMHARRASSDGTPPILHPALAFPEDRGGYGDPDAYLLGEDLFVAAVTEPGASRRALHVPPGRWIHWWTNAAYDGPADIVVDAPIGQPPVFVRAGAIVPMLAHDLETLVPAPATLGGRDRIDPADRPFLRARIVPTTSREVVTEEGVVVGYERSDVLEVRLSPVASPAPDLGWRDVRLEIDLSHAAPPVGPIRDASREGGPLRRAMPEEVGAGCDEACWAVDGSRILLSVRVVGPTRVVFSP